MTLRLRVGAPAYRMQCRVEHALMLAQLMQVDDVEVTSFDYQHTSLLPEARTRILRRAMDDTGSDVLLSVDSDVWCSFAALSSACKAAGAVMRRVGQLADPSVAMIVVLYPLDDGTPSAWGPDGAAIDAIDGRGLFQIEEAGAGFAFHSLRWHRDQLTRPPDTHGNWPGSGYAVNLREDGSMFVSEDRAFCRAVRSRGGKILAAYMGAGQVMHAACGA